MTLIIQDLIQYEIICINEYRMNSQSVHVKLPAVEDQYGYQTDLFRDKYDIVISIYHATHQYPTHWYILKYVVLSHNSGGCR